MPPGTLVYPSPVDLSQEGAAERRRDLEADPDGDVLAHVERRAGVTHHDRVRRYRPGAAFGRGHLKADGETHPDPLVPAAGHLSFRLNMIACLACHKDLTRDRNHNISTPSRAG